MGSKVKNFNYYSAVLSLKTFLGDYIGPIKIYTICTSVSSTGLSRVIKAYIVKDGEVLCIGSGRVQGCGMDMGFHVAQSIFSLAYPGLKYQEHLTHSWL